ncbi:MAG TPA: urea transporter, partial [Anaeromyxobacteraceae bacterium]|nr:urea transporter [Anaeromyxobacteraceae bacterium]
MTVARARGAGVAFGKAVLGSYSQVILASNAYAGALLLLGSLYDPVVGMAGLAAVLLSLATVHLAGFHWEYALAGGYGYNPLLLGLALGAWLKPGPLAGAVLVGSVVACVHIQVALEAALGSQLRLPALSLPFVATAYLALMVSSAFGLLHGVPSAGTAPGWLHGKMGEFLSALGGLFFQPVPLVGIAILVAIAAYSRIAAILSLLGFVVAAAVASLLPGRMPAETSLNAALTAMALGGIWFIPDRRSFMVAAAAALMTVMVGVALARLLALAYFPSLVLPFNLTALT